MLDALMLFVILISTQGVFFMLSLLIQRKNVYMKRKMKLTDLQRHRETNVNRVRPSEI